MSPSSPPSRRRWLVWQAGFSAALRGGVADRAVAYGSAVNDGRGSDFVYRQAEGAGWC
jgi:hypothetical protein